jgi:hypothetical protein
MAILYGEPVLGEGTIYGGLIDQVAVEDFEVSRNWPKIIGMDLPRTTGNLAAVKLAHDLESDTVYAYGEYLDGGKSLADHFSKLVAMGGRVIQCAWPHDGEIRSELGSTDSAVSQLRDLGLLMLPVHAHSLTSEGRKSHKIGGVIEEILERMRTGRLKVLEFACPLLLKQLRSYHHKDGRIPLKQKKDLVDALHKGMMMLDFARTELQGPHDQTNERQSRRVAEAILGDRSD